MLDEKPFIVRVVVLIMITDHSNDILVIYLEYLIEIKRTYDNSLGNSCSNGAKLKEV